MQDQPGAWDTAHKGLGLELLGQPWRVSAYTCLKYLAYLSWVLSLSRDQRICAYCVLYMWTLNSLIPSLQNGLELVQI